MAEHKKSYKSFIDKKKPYIKSNKHYEYKEEKEYTSEEKFNEPLTWFSQIGNSVLHRHIYFRCCFAV